MCETENAEIERTQTQLPYLMMPSHAPGATQSYGTQCFLAVLQSGSNQIFSCCSFSSVFQGGMFTIDSKCIIVFYKNC